MSEKDIINQLRKDLAFQMNETNYLVRLSVATMAAAEMPVDGYTMKDLPGYVKKLMAELKKLRKKKR